VTEYTAGLLVVILLYTVLSVTLNLLLSQAGLFSVAHAIFFGIGAYAMGYMTTARGTSWIVGTAAGMVVAAAIAAVVAGVSLRVSEDYFVIVSFGLQVIGLSILLNWDAVTGGINGLAAIPLPQIGSWSPDTTVDFVKLSAVVAILVVGIVALLDRSPYGRVLRASRDDPVATAALGKNPVTYKISAFIIAGSLAALAGSVYAAYRSFISPDDFGIDLSILLVAMIAVGGMGRISGAIAGTVLLELLPELLRRLSLPATAVGPVQQIIFGLLLVAVAMVRPQGLLGGTWPDFAATVRWVRKRV
jgi:branched-chain amino acid transport system permease protein